MIQHLSIPCQGFFELFLLVIKIGIDKLDYNE
jgi:hypothetical protein